jgi:hypothetical protein
LEEPLSEDPPEDDPPEDWLELPDELLLLLLPDEEAFPPLLPQAARTMAAASNMASNM